MSYNIMLIYRFIGDKTTFNKLFLNERIIKESIDDLCSKSSEGIYFSI